MSTKQRTSFLFFNLASLIEKLPLGNNLTTRLYIMMSKLIHANHHIATKK